MVNTIDFSWQVILTSVVIGSAITSITNIIILIINNYRLKNVENKRVKNEINTYRYTKLYEISIHWIEMNTKIDTHNKTISEIANDRLVNGFIDDYRKFEIIAPLLDNRYREKLTDISTNGLNYLNMLIEVENALDDKEDERLRNQHRDLFCEFKKISVQFTTELKSALQKQLDELLSFYCC